MSGNGATTYRLGTVPKLFMGAGLVFLPVVFVVESISIARGDVPGDFIGFFIIWACFVIFITARGLFRGVVRIDLDGDVLRLRSPLRSQEVSVGDVVAIETSWWDLNRFSPLIRCRGRSFRLLGPFDGFYDLIVRVKERNPSIEIKRL